MSSIGAGQEVEWLQKELTERIIGAAIDVHRALGPGLLESAYEECLCHELNLNGRKFRRQIELLSGTKEFNWTAGIAWILLSRIQSSWK